MMGPDSRGFHLNYSVRRFANTPLILRRIIVLLLLRRLLLLRIRRLLLLGPCLQLRFILVWPVGLRRGNRRLFVILPWRPAEFRRRSALVGRLFRLHYDAVVARP